VERGLDVDALVALRRAVREHIKGSLGADAGKGEGVAGMNWHVCTGVFGQQSDRFAKKAVALRSTRAPWRVSRARPCVRWEDADARSIGKSIFMKQMAFCDNSGTVVIYDFVCDM
jgi:hypothetical protein